MDYGTFQKAIAKMGVVVDESDLEQFFQIAVDRFLRAAGVPEVRILGI